MSNKITFSELVAELSENNGITKELGNEFITALVDHVLEETRSKGKSAITNFGSFNVVDVAARTGVNPRTGEEIVIPEHKRLSFTPYKALEKSVNQEFSHLEAEVVIDNPLAAPQSTTPTEETSSEAEQEVTLSKEEDPFEDILGIEEKNEDEISDSDSDSELVLEEVVDEEGVTEESNEPATPSLTPRRPERKPTNLPPIAIIGVLVIVAIGVLSVWFFTIREQTPLSENAANPNEQLETGIAASNEIADMNGEEIYDEDSVVIPMVQEDVDLSEIENETIPIQNSTPIITDIPATFVTSYSVSSGVWIYEIARQTYGNTRLWPLIFEANYTTSNNPDLILPNVELNIPELDGTAENPSGSDYQKLANAARYVAEAYQLAGNEAQYNAYIQAAVWYESMR